MKKLYFFAALLSLTCSTAFAQSAKEMQAEIEGKYTIDDNGNVTYVKVIEAPGMTQDEIFSRAQNYFTYNYGSGKSVIQTEDRDKGTLVGKGLYSKVHIGMSLVSTTVDTWHILRIDAKDGKARAILTLIQYDKTIQGTNSSASHSTTNVSDEYPINPKGSNKTVMMKAFYKSHLAALRSLESVGKAILEGSTSSAIENDAW